MQQWQEIIKDSAWVVEDLLTPEECEQFMDKAKALGIMDSISFGTSTCSTDDMMEQASSKVSASSNSKSSSADKRHRDSIRVEIDDAEMANKLFDRIKDHIPQQVWVDEDCDNDGLKYSKSELHGRWVPVEINSRWRVVLYPGSGHFGPHRDGCRFIDDHHRSLITINGYLTDRPRGFGGATRFVKDNIDVQLNDNGLFTVINEDDVLHRVEADKQGKAVVFFHDLMHDGEPLKPGSAPKWLFRTEIIFERDPETAPKLTDDEREARGLFKEAVRAEERGEIAQAIALYKRAFRLDSTLDSSNKTVIL